MVIKLTIVRVYNLTVRFQVDSVVESFYSKLNVLMVNSDELSQLASLGPSWQVHLWAIFFK